MEWKISQLIQIEKWNAIVVEKGWKIKFKLCGVKFWWNGMELEWKQNGPFTKKKFMKNRKEMEWKLKGSGME